MSRGKFLIIGLAASLAVQLTLGIIEISDHRKGRRRMSPDDIQAIADSINKKQTCTRGLPSED